jgi:hypothetical protein
MNWKFWEKKKGIEKEEPPRTRMEFSQLNKIGSGKGYEQLQNGARGRDYYQINQDFAVTKTIFVKDINGKIQRIEALQRIQEGDIFEWLFDSGDNAYWKKFNVVKVYRCEGCQTYIEVEERYGDDY